MDSTTKTVIVRVLHDSTTTVMRKLGKTSTVALAKALSLDYSDADYLIRCAQTHQVSTLEIPINTLLKYAQDNLAQQGVIINLTMK